MNRWQGFLRSNNINLYNAVTFPRYFAWVMWMWFRWWGRGRRFSLRHIVSLFPLDVRVVA